MNIINIKEDTICHKRVWPDPDASDAKEKEPPQKKVKRTSIPASTNPNQYEQIKNIVELRPSDAVPPTQAVAQEPTQEKTIEKHDTNKFFPGVSSVVSPLLAKFALPKEKIENQVKIISNQITIFLNNEDVVNSRYSKKDSQFPLTYSILVLKNKKITMIQFYAPKSYPLIGEGSNKRIKQCFSFLIDLQGIEEPKELNRILIRFKNHINHTEAIVSTTKHSEIYKYFKQFYPETHITEPMLWSTYVSKHGKKRVEGSMLRYDGDLSHIVTNKNSKLLEYCDKIRTTNYRIQILGDFIEGIKKLHALGFIHRDIKPANILVDKGIDGKIHGLLHDFDFSQELGKSEYKDNFIFWDKMGQEGIALPNSDIYALALTATLTFIPKSNEILISLPSLLKDPVNAKTLLFNSIKSHLANAELDESFVREFQAAAQPDLHQSWAIMIEKMITFIDSDAKDKPFQEGALKKLKTDISISAKVFYILIRELENSQKLYDFFQANPEALAKVTNPLEPVSVRKRHYDDLQQQLGLTSIDTIAAEIQELGK